MTNINVDMTGMSKNEFKKGEIIIYKTSKGPEIQVKFEADTIWLTQAQIAELFNVQRPAITKHLNNIFKEGELEENSVCSILEHTTKHGAIKEKTQTQSVKFYNLDAIISIGYRVNSRHATQFRIWATSVLRDYIVKGVAVNQKRIEELQGKQLEEFNRALALLEKAKGKALASDEALGLLDVITSYAKSWLLLQKYDEGLLEIGKTSKSKYKIEYDEAIKSISQLKKDLTAKKEVGDLFGLERGDMIKGILTGINQSFGGQEIYPSIEEKAAHLLYFIIKDHPFSDGNKRIGSFMFILFLAKNNYLYNKKGEKKINDNALVALALMVAESNPKEKDIMTRLIINFLNNQ